MVVFAYFAPDALQIMIQAEVMTDETIFNILELQHLVNLAHFQNAIANDSEPPFSQFFPSENLSATESNIQV